MAKKIYIGNMLQEVQTSIAALQTDMGDVSVGIDNLVSEMAEVSSLLSQSVNKLVVKDGIDKEVIFSNIETTHTNSTSYKTAFTFKCKCDGFINLGVECKTSHVSGGLVAYSLNGGAEILFTGFTNFFTNADYQPFNEVISVEDGDEIAVKIKNYTTGGYNTSINAGAKVSYSLVNIIDEGAVILK